MPDIRKKYMDFLTGEIDYWQEEEIITDEQAEQILSLYDIKTFNLHKILLIAGAVLLGLGLVSFIASQWHMLNRFLRVIIIIGAYCASLTAYYSAHSERPRLAQSFLLLASVIFGAGIFLTTRMFDYKLSFTSLLGWWSIAVIITALASRDTWQLYFSQIISILYLNLINAIDIFALQFVNLPREPLSQFFLPVNAFILVIALWCIWFLVRDRVTLNVNILITLLLAASRMSLCFGGTLTLIILAVLGALMSFTRHHDTEIFGLLMLGLFGLLLTWSEFWRGDTFAAYSSYLPVITALFVAVIMLVNIYRGHYVIGIVFFAMLLIRYFFDNFFGYVPKAWGFSLTGIIFVIAGGIISLRKSAKSG